MIRKFNTKYLSTGFLYFYIHFVTEVICFFVLGRYIASVPLLWLTSLTYDYLAFVPQSVIGYINDKFPKIPFALIGIVLLAAALVLHVVFPSPFASLFVLCLGNAMIHVNGAEVTLKTSSGSLSHSAIFVSGGSFGVVTGRLLSKTAFPAPLLLLLIASSIPFAILAQMLLEKAGKNSKEICAGFNYNRKNISRYVVILVSVAIVIVRGYMGYGIPTSWRKTTLQTILFFVFMGIGKAMGGVLTDIFGMKKVAVSSVILALPLLMFGDKNMYVSLIGVMFFSMTMSITLALLVSVLKKTPGLAFGLTTIGLFLGTFPIFFFKIKGFAASCVMLSALTILCVIGFLIIIGKDSKNERVD